MLNRNTFAFIGFVFLFASGCSSCTKGPGPTDPKNDVAVIEEDAGSSFTDTAKNREDTGTDTFSEDMAEVDAGDVCDPYRKKSFIVDGGMYHCKSVDIDKGKWTLKIFVGKGNKCDAKAVRGSIFLFWELAKKLEKKGEGKFKVETGDDGGDYTCTLL